jgi:uncharacterized protein YidB (DUF937 family)
MGLMDTLTGLLKSGGVKDSLIKSVSSMFQDGSLSLSRFKEQADKAGLSDIFDSWVSQGENKPITADQVKQTADPENLQAIADKAGLSVDETAEELSRALPEIVNEMTPDGVLPSDDQVRAAVTAG